MSSFNTSPAWAAALCAGLSDWPAGAGFWLRSRWNRADMPRWDRGTVLRASVPESLEPREGTRERPSLGMAVAVASTAVAAYRMPTRSAWSPDVLGERIPGFHRDGKRRVGRRKLAPLGAEQTDGVVCPPGASPRRNMGRLPFVSMLSVSQPQRTGRSPCPHWFPCVSIPDQRTVDRSYGQRFRPHCGWWAPIAVSDGDRQKADFSPSLAERRRPCGSSRMLPQSAGRRSYGPIQHVANSAQMPSGNGDCSKPDSRAGDGVPWRGCIRSRPVLQQLSLLDHVMKQAEECTARRVIDEAAALAA